MQNIKGEHKEEGDEGGGISRRKNGKKKQNVTLGKRRRSIYHVDKTTKTKHLPRFPKTVGTKRGEKARGGGEGWVHEDVSFPSPQKRISNCRKKKQTSNRRSNSQTSNFSHPCFFPSFLPSFLPSFFPSFLPSFLPSFVRSFVRSFVPPLPPP